MIILDMTKIGSQPVVNVQLGIFKHGYRVQIGAYPCAIMYGMDPYKAIGL